MSACFYESKLIGAFWSDPQCVCIKGVEFTRTSQPLGDLFWVFNFTNFCYISFVEPYETYPRHGFESLVGFDVLPPCAAPCDTTFCTVGITIQVVSERLDALGAALDGRPTGAVKNSRLELDGDTGSGRLCSEVDPLT